MRNKTLLLLVVGAVLLASGAAGAGEPPPSPGLPDWSGDWVVEPFQDPAPSYTAAWIAARKARLGDTPPTDPAKTCGVFAGTPRMLGLPGIHEWIITPGAVRHALEDDFNSVQRIFTDGRPHAAPDDLFPNYTGDNTGRWEGDVLVIDTVGLRDDTWLDDQGHDHSDQIHIVSRVRKLADGRLELRAQVDDPVAFAKPWTITRHYKRLPANSFVRDYACGIVKTGEQAATLY